MSSISELPTTEEHCIDCHRNPDHPICGKIQNQDSPDIFENSEESLVVDDQECFNIDKEGAPSPLKIKRPKNFQEKGKEVWTEDNPGSERAARPIITAMQKESRSNVQSMIENFLEKEIVSLTNYATKPSEKNLRVPVIIIAMESGILVPISTDLNFGAMDNKLTKMVTGRTGAFCTACSASAEDMHNEKLISEGFYMDIGTDCLNLKFEEIAKKFDIGPEEILEWEIPSKKGDYKERLGLKKAPMTREFEITKVCT